METRIPPDLLWLSLGSIGGIVRVFFNYLNDPNPPTWGKFFIIVAMNMVISGFAGYMGALFGSLVNDSIKWVIICAGIGGYMGVASIEVLATVVKSKFTGV